MFGNSAQRKILHAADNDLRILHRDANLRLRGLFDTRVAARLIGEPDAETSLAALCHAVCNRDAPPLAAQVPGVELAFARIVDRCLRTDPRARFAAAVRRPPDPESGGAAPRGLRHRGAASSFEPVAG